MTPKKPKGPTTQGAYALEQRRKLEQKIQRLETELANEKSRSTSRGSRVPR